MNTETLAAPNERRLTNMTSQELREGYAGGSFTPVDLLKETLRQIDSVNPHINAIAYRNDDEAVKQAEDSAQRWAAGTPLGPLDGMPISIKDSVNSAGTPWRHGSKGHLDVPDPVVDSPPAARLKEGGAVIFAKTAMPDFGMAASGVSSLYGTVRNPWNLTMSPGGSSAGAGASLAAGIGVASIGSDIAGSVRLPAAHCGLFALKPTQGRIPHLAPSTIRSAGPMARTVAEGAELFSVITQPDARDNLSFIDGPVDVTPDVSLIEVSGLKVGLLLDMGYGEMVHPLVEKVVRSAAQALGDAGATVSDVPPLFDSDPYLALDRLFQVRARAEWRGVPEEKRDQVLRNIVEWSAEADSFSAIQHENDLHTVMKSAARVGEALHPYDVILSPVLPGLGLRADMVGLDQDRPLAHCSFTCWSNQTGQPAASVAFDIVEELPVGVQVIGQRFEDASVIQVAGWLEANRSVEMLWPTEPRTGSELADSLFAGAARRKENAA